MSTAYQVLGICGSLRQKSFNMMALKAAGELMPEGMSLRIASIADIPLFNQDILDQGIPAAVARLRDEIAQADGLLFANPEYNFSLTGAMKNAIDWVSRVPNQPFADKPVAMLSASSGIKGGVTGQYELRKVLAQLNAFLLVRPEVIIGQAPTKFDAQGRLTDEAARKFMTDQGVAFRDWITRAKKLK